MAKNRDTKATKDSDLFIDKTEDKKIAPRNKRIGASYGVLLIVTAFSPTHFAPKSTNTKRDAKINRVCLGRANVSVVKVAKTRGKESKNKPKTRDDNKLK